MLRWSIPLFRVRDIQLSLHASFLLLIGYFGYLGYTEGGRPGLAWALALLFGFVTCVVLHELGHSLTAQRFGVGVRRILLMPIGGMAEFDTIPREPKKEFLITIAGPAVNFVIAGVLIGGLKFFGVAPALVDVPGNLAEYAWSLASVNVALGLFNLLPVFPMDGGRILRAALATRLNYVRATFWAATVAKILSLAIVAAVEVLGFTGVLTGFTVFTGVFYAALFLFIFVVGELEYRAARTRERQEAEFTRWAQRLAAARAAVVRAETPFPPDPPLLDQN